MTILIKNLKKNKKNLFDYVLPFHKSLLHQDLYAEVLHSSKVLNVLKEILGPDLAHHEDPSLAVNISNLNLNSNQDKILKNIGYVPQSSYLFEDSLM